MVTRPAVCNLCEAICGLELTIEDGRVAGVRGDPRDPLSRGHICPKGVALGDLHADPDRLRRPMQRTSAGWREVGWDVALDRAADAMAAAIRTGGRDALGIYLGNPNVHSLGSMTHGVTMAKGLGTRNRFSATSVDQLPHQLVAHLMFGHQLLLPVPDVDRTSYFVVFGANPLASNGSLMTAPDLPERLRALRRRGGQMIVFDPRRTETAKVATAHHHIRPGTDAFVLLAMLQVVITEGLVNPAEYVDGLSEVTTAVAGYSPERAEAVSGVPAAVIRDVARTLATTGRAVAYGRLGVSAHPFGTLCQWAINALNIVTGHLDRIGGAMFTTPAIDVIDGLVGPGHFGAWHSRVSGLPEAAGELPATALCDEIETPGEGQIRALLTVAGNPVLSVPGGSRLDQLLPTLDFMAAVDIYLNETTRHADVILPPTTILERDHYDLIFHTLAVRNTARFTPAVFSPPPGSRHDWQIYRDLTVRILARLGVPARRRLAIRARLTPTPTQLIGWLLRRGGSGLTLATLRARPSGVDLGPLRSGRLPARLPRHRVDLFPALIGEEMDRLAATPPPAGLLLIGRRHLRDCNSWLHNLPRLTRGRQRHRLLMHPDDLAVRDLVDGQTVSIRSATGVIRTEVTASNDVVAGVVCLPHGYGHGREGTKLGRANAVPGASSNDITDPTRLDVSGTAVLTGVPVDVTAVQDRLDP